MKFLTLSATLSLGLLLGLAGCSTMPSPANTQQINVYAVSEQGMQEKIGTIRFYDSAEGLVLKTRLSHIPSGPHGFHLHDYPDCGTQATNGQSGAALGAGGHFNPTQVPHHGSPTMGHLGDLPVLVADDNGNANQTLIAPRLSVKTIQQHAIIIHAGGDNYSDSPKPLGGGGNRIACGIIA
ncbi:superoxide dismutase family protein [Acinetobacter sp. MD2(2019)]|uniref:superoxide dismutase family protein n=1 Tax=Acinetobacter sp. MD2(2019) TaxID=2605273 RepID=UPI002D1F3B85|nr:superoxide dismutase family protein [Acinetobacter sp. MD2(2019)]MEB3753269.1 superoxide dismutase family protein [Acinetobacter sp. MD2(2019)]